MPIGAITAGVGLYGANKASKSAKEAANASIEGSQIAADAQMAGLDYLKERDALGNQLSDQAKQHLSDYYQVPGQPMTYEQLVAQSRANPLYQMRSQDQQIAEAKGSPLYNAIMGTKQDAVDEMARYQSMNGGFRSGGGNVNLAREGQRVANEALLQSYNAVQQRDAYNNQAVVDTYGAIQGRDDYRTKLNLTGLTGLAGLQGNDQAIANLTGDIGFTQGQGRIASSQALQQGTQNSMNNLMGILGLGITGYGNGAIKF